MERGMASRKRIGKKTENLEGKDVVRMLIKESQHSRSGELCYSCKERPDGQTILGEWKVARRISTGKGAVN